MPVTEIDADLVAIGNAMASRIEVRARRGGCTLDGLRNALDEVLAVFAHVDRTCTRFNVTSDLMRANARGGEWVQVDRWCFNALVEACAAYRRTRGRFDPRVLNDLVRLGYSSSWTKQRPDAGNPAQALQPRPPLEPWRPTFRAATCEVKVGPRPIDLGGIGKGLAVRWAGELLRRNGVHDFLVEAGGDVLCAGAPADGPTWRVAVEDPRSSSGPVAVLELCDEGVATSSVRLRTWNVGDHQVHHLIDPSTGAPGGEGLLAVTVVDADPARAEVWSKVLFLAGRVGVDATARLFGVPALWVDVDGTIATSPALGERLIWRSAA